jgi:hypothetical protein
MPVQLYYAHGVAPVAPVPPVGPLLPDGPLAPVGAAPPVLVAPMSAGVALGFTASATLATRPLVSRFPSFLILS